MNLDQSNLEFLSDLDKTYLCKVEALLVDYDPSSHDSPSAREIMQKTSHGFAVDICEKLL